MKISAFIGWIALSTGCDVKAEKPPASPAEQTPSQETQTMKIRESAQGTLGDAEVGVSNIWEREYTLPDGKAQTGLTARLSLDEGVHHFVGKGSIFEASGTRWEVVAVESDDDKPGSVTFAEAK